MEEEREDYTEEEILEEKPRIWVRVVRGAVAVLVLVGLVYISGVYQYFFLQRTPPTAEQQQVESLVQEERITVPLTVFIVTNSEALGSHRTKEDVMRLVENADTIWNQANIDLVIKNISVVSKTDEEIETFFDDPDVFANSVEGFDWKGVNVFLLGSLEGLNGVAFGGVPIIAVADYTASYDFRVLAHEIGHRLGLNHVPSSKGALMYQGADGFEISLPEALRAREVAKQLSNTL